MLSAVVRVHAFNLDYAKRLVADLSPAQMTAQPKPAMNHPAWVLGHLAATGDYSAQLLGLPAVAPAAWEPLFGMQSKPLADAANYPSKADLLGLLDQQHARVTAALAKATAAQLAEPTPHEEFRKMVPTVGDALAFLLTAHEAIHLGQLSAWRRASGLPAV